MELLKTCIITGAYGAIGKAIARQMAKKRYRTILVGRDESRLKKAAEEIKSVTDNSEVYYEIADLSRKSSIIDLSERWKWPLNVMINNAASSPQKRIETPEGIGLEFKMFWL